jgi:hypothetical protein
MAEDLRDAGEVRWPAFSGAMLGDGVRGVFAFPVNIATTRVGALDLFRRTAGALDDELWEGAKWASRLAALPLLDDENHGNSPESITEIPHLLRAAVGH